LAVGFRGNLVNTAVVFPVRIGICCHTAHLVWRHPVEIVLIDIQLDLNIVEVRECYDKRLCPAIPNERGRHHFSLLHVSLENRS
jgi:hypothetical protein